MGNYKLSASFCVGGKICIIKIITDKLLAAICINALKLLIRTAVKIKLRVPCKPAQGLLGNGHQP